MDSEKTNEARSLDAQISRISKSTRTSIGIALPLHDIIRQKSPWYYKWHLNPLSSKVHVALLLLYLVFISYFSYTVFIKPEKVTIAAGLTCTSAFDGYFADPGIWDAGCGGGVPGTDDNVVIAHSVDMDGDVDLGSGNVTINSPGIFNLYDFSLSVNDMTVNTGGTLAADASNITVSGSWNHSAGTFTRGTSTIIMTGTGTFNTGGNTKPITNLQVIGAGETVTLSARTSLAAGGILTVGSSSGAKATIAGGQQIDLQSAATPPIVFVGTYNAASGGGYNIDNTTISYFVNGDHGISGGTYGGLYIRAQGTADRTATLLGDLTTTGLLEVHHTGSYTATLDTDAVNSYDITVGAYFYLASATTSRYAVLKCNNSTLNFLSNVEIRASDTPGKTKFDANNATIYVGRDWNNYAVFDADTSNVHFRHTSNANRTVKTNNSAFYDVEFDHTADPNSFKYTITDNLDINHNLTITDGRLDLSTNNPVVTVGGNFNLLANGVWTKSTSGLNFDGTTTFTDSTATPQNLGVVTMSGTSVTLASSMTLDTLNLSAGILDLASAGYTLQLANAGATDAVLTCTGTLSPGTNSTVQYSATNSGDNVTVTACPYNNLKISGAETYDLGGDLTVGNSLTGDLTVDVGATLDTTAANSYDITLAGSWSSPGTIAMNASTVTFNGAGEETIVNSDGDFYDIVVNGVGGKWTYGGAGACNLQTLEVSAGTFDTGSVEFIADVTLSGGSLLGNSEPMRLSGLTISDADSIFRASRIVELTGVYDQQVSPTSPVDWTTNNSELYVQSADQTLPPDTYYYLVVTDAAVTLATGETTINNNLLIRRDVEAASSLAVGANTLTVLGDLTIQSAGNTLAVTLGTINVGGDWTNSGTFTAGTGTTVFDGTTAILGTSENTFNNVSITGALTAPAANINITGNWTNSATFTANGGTLTFNGTTDQLLNPGASALFNLTINNTTIGVQLTGNNLTVANKLYLYPFAAFSMGESNLTMTLSGAIEDPFDISAGDEMFLPGISTVIYAGVNPAGTVNVTTTTYDSIRFSGAETYVLTGDLSNDKSLVGNLTIDTDAILDTSAGNYDISLTNDWSNSGTFTANAGTVNFNGLTTQTLVGDTTFYDLTMDASVAKTINFPTGLANKTTISGTWNLNNSAVEEGDRLTLASSTPTTAWEFVIPANMTSGNYITVSDSQNNTNAFRITPGTNVTDSGNNKPGWLFAPTAPVIGVPVAASSTSIEWHFTDTSSDELGFKVYDSGDNLVATCATPDLTFCTETGLSVNTQYTGRYVVAYNAGGNSTPSATAAAKYTLADTPLAPTVTVQSWDVANGNALSVIINENTNPPQTEFAVACNATPDSWLQGDGTCAGGKIWKNKAEWETGTVNYLLNLPADTDYTLLSKARNGDNEEILSPTSGPNKTAPAQITNLGHSGNTETTISWQWDANTTAPDGYNIYEYTGGACTLTQEATVAAPAITVDEGSLSANTAYSRCGRAYRGAILGQPATDTSAYTSIETPTGITFGTLATDSIEISASGTISNLAEGTSGLYFTETTGGGGGAGFDSWTQVNALTDSGLSINTQYGYKVKARNGNSEETGETAVLSKYTLSNPPLAPTVDGATNTTLTVKIDINSNPAATEFAIYNETLTKYVQADGSSGAAAVWQNYAAWGGIAGIANTGLSQSTTYAYTVKARNGDNVESAMSPSGSGTTTGVAPTPTPTHTATPTATPTVSPTSTTTPTPTPTSPITASPTATATPTAGNLLPPSNIRTLNLGAITLTLAWDNPSGNQNIVGYQIYNAETNILVGTTSKQTFDFVGLIPNTTYKFYVRAYDVNNNIGPDSAILTITTSASTTPEEEEIARLGGIVSFLVLGGAPTDAQMGKPLASKIKLTAADVGGKVVQTYSKSVYFASSDPLSKLAFNEANPYTFSAVDKGVHEFTGTDFIFNSIGSQTLVASDYSTSTTVNIEVTSATANVLKRSSTYVRSFFADSDNISYANIVIFILIAGVLILPTLVKFFSNLGSLIPQLTLGFTNFFQILGWRKKRKPWGVVFNSQTGQPIPYVVVKLIDKHNKLIEASISDHQGKYGFGLKHGTYRINADRIDFKYPSTNTTTGFYERVYKGSEIKIVDDKQDIIFNIAMDPYAKYHFATNFWLWLVVVNKYLQKIRLPLLVLGIIFASIMLIINFSLMYLLLMLFCLSIIILGLVSPRKASATGQVSDVYDHNISNAIIRIYHKDDNKLIDTGISDGKGRFGFKVKPGIYYVIAAKVGYVDFKSHLVYLQKNQKKQAITAITIKLKKITT